jgi:hypothetical protein
MLTTGEWPIPAEGPELSIIPRFAVFLAEVGRKLYDANTPKGWEQLWPRYSEDE